MNSSPMTRIPISISKRNRAGQIINYEYDELNRLKSKTRPSEPNTVYRYDIAGRLYDVD